MFQFFTACWYFPLAFQVLPNVAVVHEHRSWLLCKIWWSAIRPSVEYVLHLPSNCGNAFPIWALPYGNVSAIAFNDRFRILIRSKNPWTGGNWTIEQRKTETILFAHQQLQFKKNDTCPVLSTGLQVERFCERILCPCCQSDIIQEDATIAICAKVIRALRNHQDIRDVVLGQDCFNLSQSFIAALRTECALFRRIGASMMIYGINCC